MSQKSYNNTPTLYLIPTPIGNLDDITYRAVKVLKEVDVLFSEDTRVTQELLNYFSIKKRCISSHKYNEHQNKEKLISYLSSGNSVGLVSDRGTPVVSDPGYELAKEAINNGYNVVGLPGATALIPALIMSGLDANHFLFYGFLDHKSSKRKAQLQSLKDFNYTMIFYESPHRIEKVLNEMMEIFGNRKISISREISKKFEEIYRGSISNLLLEIKDSKGEFVIVVDGNKEIKNFDYLSVIEHVNLYIKEGYSSKDAIKIVSKERNKTKSEIYSIYHNIKK